jgi:hypothetical protein
LHCASRDSEPPGRQGWARPWQCSRPSTPASPPTATERDPSRARAEIVAAGITLGLLGSTGGSFAPDYCPPPAPEKVKCNAGNGSEGCDPGNSGTHNRGVDEDSQRRGSQRQPGGNNVP